MFIALVLAAALPLSPTHLPPLRTLSLSLLLISQLKSVRGCGRLQKEAVMCINAYIESGRDTCLRHGALLRKLDTSSDSLVMPCFYTGDAESTTAEL